MPKCFVLIAILFFSSYLQAQVAGDALGAVKESAQAHGLTADKPIGELANDLKSGELLGHVKQAAQEVASASKQSLRSQLRDEKGDPA